MTRDAKKPEAFVREVTESTMAYVRALQRDVTSLRARVSALESEKARLQSEADQRTGQLAEQYSIIEQQHADLANLYVASYRLHDTLDRQELLSVIEEILCNLVGSEELGIFELSPDRDALFALKTMGIDQRRFESLPARGGLVGRAVTSGELYIAGEHSGEGALPHEAGLTACIPLRQGEKVSGAITVFRLLGHKPGLTRIDRELFELLASHAGTALYCSALHGLAQGAQAGAAPAPKVG